MSLVSPRFYCTCALNPPPEQLKPSWASTLIGPTAPSLPAPPLPPLLQCRLASNCCWLTGYQPVISDTFSTCDAACAKRKSKLSCRLTRLKSSPSHHQHQLYFPSSLSCLCQFIPPSIPFLPAPPPSPSPRLWPRVVRRNEVQRECFSACLCNRKQCTSGAQSADWGDADGRWKSSPVALAPPHSTSPTLARVWLQPPGRMKSALTKCGPLMDGQSRELDVRMDGGQRGKLTRTNKMKDGEELPAKAFRQHNSHSNLLSG